MSDGNECGVWDEYYMAVLGTGNLRVAKEKWQAHYEDCAVCKINHPTLEKNYRRTPWSTDADGGTIKTSDYDTVEFRRRERIGKLQNECLFDNK